MTRRLTTDYGNSYFQFNQRNKQMSSYIVHKNTIQIVAKHFTCNPKLWTSRLGSFEEICQQLSDFNVESVRTRYKEEPFHEDHKDWSIVETPNALDGIDGHKQVLGYLRCIRYQSIDGTEEHTKKVDEYFSLLIDLIIAVISEGYWDYSEEDYKSYLEDALANFQS